MAVIDIRTTQNVIIEYELASLRERMLAFLLDALIVGVTYIFLANLLEALLPETIRSSGLLQKFIKYLLPISGFILYHLLSEIIANGQSWGKKSLNIKVVRLDGQEAGLSDYVLRAVFHLIDTIASLGVMAALFIIGSERKQRLGDMAAHTAVIRLKHNLQFELEDILKIDSIERYEPSFPQVRQLSEQDMLLIKTVINRYRDYPNEAHEKVITELTERLQQVLDIVEKPQNKIEFLKTLIRDYIVLTR